MDSSLCPNPNYSNLPDYQKGEKMTGLEMMGLNQLTKLAKNPNTEMFYDGQVWFK